MGQGKKLAFLTYWRLRIAISNLKGVARAIANRIPICTGDHFPITFQRFTTIDMGPTPGPALNARDAPRSNLDRDQMRSYSKEERQGIIDQHDQLSCYFGFLGQLNRNPKITLRQVDLVIRSRDWVDCVEGVCATYDSDVARARASGLMAQLHREQEWA
mmetsp:Transcript_23487/g.54162  ORF Transcript_23487/g.54162 Transcript_23487/m.54162 type:complete len:159 (-) Transcript_23487:76-552(-)